MSNTSAMRLRADAFTSIALAVTLLLLGGSAALADGDAAAGNKVFVAQCSVCHSDKPGVNGFGPSLAGVVGRSAAAITSFNYTTALRIPASPGTRRISISS
jgi:cytochrome c2